MQEGMVGLFWATDLLGRDEKITGIQSCCDTHFC